MGQTFLSRDTGRSHIEESCGEGGRVAEVECHPVVLATEGRATEKHILGGLERWLSR